MRERLQREYFEKLYTESPDPWEFTTSEYERRKYEQTLRSLARSQVRTGVGGWRVHRRLYRNARPLLRRIARRGHLRTRRGAGPQAVICRENVRVEQRTLPEEMPGGPFGLIVASEVLYYLPEETMLFTLRRLEEELSPGGALLAVHWRKETRTYPLQGDEVHHLLVENTRLKNVKTVVEPEYRLDLFEDLA